MAEPTTSWIPPPRFEQFAVVRPLGRRGMGDVYLARDVALERPVALKFISGEASETSRRRFLTETEGGGGRHRAYLDAATRATAGRGVKPLAADVVSLRHVISDGERP